MFCITGNSSQLKCILFPPFDMTSSSEWEMGFLDLMTYNSIPNVEENVNNKIYLGTEFKVSLPTGAYEIDDINKYINKELKLKKDNIIFSLTPNNNTLKSELYCTERIDFSCPHTLAPLLGFDSNTVLEPMKIHESHHPVTINRVDVIRITCNLVRGSYRDGKEGHVLHEFYPSVEPGFKIIEKPTTVKYLPVHKQANLSEFTIRLEDQNGDLVNFRGENINLRVDLRPRI